jgi:hypothetical protein
VAKIVDDLTGEIDYDQALILDAEDLAEAGIKDKYDEDVAPHLIRLGLEPAPVHELVEPFSAELPSGRYIVESQDVRYEIYGPDTETESWARATFALFDIVNRQLDHLDTKFFAVNGGNDLIGLFMTPDEAELARRALPRKMDWPYIVTPEQEWGGMYHD